MATETLAVFRIASKLTGIFCWVPKGEVPSAKPGGFDKFDSSIRHWKHHLCEPLTVHRKGGCPWTTDQAYVIRYGAASGPIRTKFLSRHMSPFLTTKNSITKNPITFRSNWWRPHHGIDVLAKI